MYLKGKKCYLSGPIEHHPHRWQDSIKESLYLYYGLDVFNPVEDPVQITLKELNRLKREGRYDLIREIVKKVVRKDLSRLDACDLVISYVPSKIPSVGTVHEIITALSQKKPVLAVANGDINSIPLWYYGILHYNYMFHDWDELFKYLESVNKGEQKDDPVWALLYGLI